MNEKMNRLSEIFCDIFDDENLTIGEETDIREIEGWDSLIHISLMAAIQEEFGVQYDIDEITGMNTISDILTSLDKK